jgi:hypothetical protein
MQAVTTNRLPRLHAQQEIIDTTIDLKLFSALKQQPCKFIVNFSDDSVTFFKQLEILAKTHKYAESLTLNFAESLTLSFDSYSGLTDQVMLQLSKFLPHQFFRLKSFTFKVNGITQLTTTGYQDLAATLQRLKSLEELNLGLKPRFNQPVEALSTIFQSIKGIKRLKKLGIELDITWDYIDQYKTNDEQLFSVLAESIQRHRSLTELNLCIDGCSRVSTDSITSLAKRLPDLVSLEQFRLAFPQINQLPENFNELVTALKPLKFLVSLGLHVPQTEYSTETACETLKNIASLAQLRTLQLDLGQELSSATLSEIANTLHQLEHLTGLSLGLSGKFDDSMLTVCQSVFKNIANLNWLAELDLSLHDCWTITDQFITNFAEAIRVQQHKLTELRLTLWLVHNLTDANLLELTQAMENLPNLSKCSLNIFHCPKVSEEGVTALIFRLGNLKSLINLSLQVYGCPITDTSLEQLGASLSQLNYLSELWLVFMNGSQITKVGINHLTSNLNKLTNLTALTLELFYTSDEVFQQGQAQIESAVRKLPKLKKLEVRID